MGAIAGSLVGVLYGYYSIILPVRGHHLNGISDAANAVTYFVSFLISWLIGTILSSISGGVIG